jgi:hypothetical protein
MKQPLPTVRKMAVSGYGESKKKKIYLTILIKNLYLLQIEKGKWRGKDASASTVPELVLTKNMNLWLHRALFFYSRLAFLKARIKKASFPNLRLKRFSSYN